MWTALYSAEYLSPHLWHWSLTIFQSSNSASLWECKYSYMVHYRCTNKHPWLQCHAHKNELLQAYFFNQSASISKESHLSYFQMTDIEGTQRSYPRKRQASNDFLSYHDGRGECGASVWTGQFCGLALRVKAHGATEKPFYCPWLNCAHTEW